MIIATAALALTLSACGSQTPDTTYVTSSDPELRARVAELLPEMAARARMELVRPIRAEKRSREELETYLLHKLDEDLPAEEAAHLTKVYSFVGAVEEDLDLRALLVSVYEEQVAGFYDPDSTALFVMDDMPEETLESVLIHELVHAVQDQTANLDSLTAEERGNDRQAAAQSAIEGHATLIMLEYMAEQIQGQPVDLSQLPDFSQAMGPALEMMKNQYPALASAPAIVQEALLFPYLKGATWMAAFWKGVEGRPAPFGEYLPQSTEQILRPSLAFGNLRDAPTEIRIDAVRGHDTLYTNTFGQGEFEVILEEHLGPDGRDLAHGWDGDRYALLRGPDGEEGLVWVSVWDSEEERDVFLSGFSPTVDGFASASALRPMDVYGRPGAILQVGLLGEIEVRLGEGTQG